jgi:hypothetical protein
MHVRSMDVTQVPLVALPTVPASPVGTPGPQDGGTGYANPGGPTAAAVHFPSVTGSALQRVPIGVGRF